MEPGTLVLLKQDVSLGPGRVAEGSRDVGNVEVEVVESGVRMRLRVETIARYPLHIGQRLAWPGRSPGPLTVIEVYDDDGRSLRRCLVEAEGHRECLPESVLVPIPPARGDLPSWFEGLRWDPPHHYFARQSLTLRRTRWYEDTEGIPTLRGARVHPLAHQIHAARRILSDRVRRFVLADEVGLGKTIEVGLVIQALLSHDPALKVLIVTPGSMSRQWQCEIYLRFGAHVFETITSGTAERAKARETPRLIVSTAALTSDPRLRRSLVKRPWDLVVVDEAHQIPPKHPLYDTLQALAQTSDGFLVLSATPSKREIEGLLGLLALVAPDVWPIDAPALLERRFEERQAVWQVLDSTIGLLGASRQDSPTGEPDAETVAFIIEDWEASIEGDAEVTRLLDRARDGETEALDMLVAHAQEHYRVDHRILRTRRRSLDKLGQRFPSRTRTWLEYPASSPEALLAEHAERLPLAMGEGRAAGALRVCLLEALSTTPAVLRRRLEARLAAIARGPSGRAEAIADALESDPGPDEEARLRGRLFDQTAALPGEQAWLEAALGLTKEWERVEKGGCARHRAVLDHLDACLGRDPEHKVLVFARDHEVVLELTAALRAARPAWSVQAFHHGMAGPELEAAARAFQQAGRSARVLVSDELGGEGRNFQIADAVVHLDTPSSVARIEQRIGRLDRMGRAIERPVLSIVLRGPFEAERRLQEVHDDVFEVYTGSVGGLEFVLPQLQRMLFEARSGRRDMTAVAVNLRQAVRQMRETVDQEYDQSLDTSRHHLERAQDLASLIEEATESDAAEDERAVKHWLGTLGFRKIRGHRTVAFAKPADPSDDIARLAGFVPQTTSHGTFAREQAVDDESLQYFAPGHVLVDAALAGLTRSSRGCATVLARNLGADAVGRWFVVLLGVGRLDESLWDEGRIPAGLATRAHQYLWPQAEVTCVRIDPRGEDPPALVTDRSLQERLTRVFERSTGDHELTVDDLAGGVDLARLWEAVRRGFAAGIAEQQRLLDGLREEAADELRDALRPENGYLGARAGRGEPAGREALEQRVRLVQSVRRAYVVAEGIALIYGRNA